MTGGVEGGVDSDAAAAEAARQREIARQQAEAAARAQAKAEADAAQAEGGTGDVAQASAVSGPGDVPAETDPGFNEAVAADTAGPNPASVDASGSYLHGDPSMGPNRSGDNGDHDETPVAATGLASGMFTASKAIQSLTVSKDEDPRDTAEIAAARAQLVAMRDAPEGTYSAEVLQQIDDELAAYTALNDFDDAKVAFNKGMQPLPEQRAALERSYAKIANSDILQPEVKLQMEAILFATSDEGMAIQANLQTALAGIEATSADKVGASGHAGKNARHNQREALKAYQEAYAAYQEAVPPRLAATLPASASDYLAAHAADLATAGDTAGAENTRMHAEAYFSRYDKHSDVLIASATLPKAQDTQAEASAFTQKLEKLDVHIATQAQLHQSRDDMATALETLGNSDLGTLVDADAATQTLSELDDAVMRYNDAMALNEGDEGHLSTEQLLADTAERYLTDGDFAAAKTYLHRLQDHNPSSAPYVANRLQAVDAGIAAYNSEHADKDDDMLSLAQSQLEALDKAYTQEVKAFWSQDATNIGGVARDQATRLGLGDQAYRDAKQEADARLAYLQEVTSAFEAGDPDVSLYDLNQARSEANKAVTHAIDLNTKGDVKGAEFSAAVAQGVRDTSIATTVLVATGGAAGIGAAGSMGLAAAGKGLAAGGIASVAMTGASWAGHKMHGLESEFSLTRELATDGINIATSLAFAPGGVLAGQAMNVGTATAKQAALRAVTNAAAEASIDGAGEALLTYGTTGDLKQAMTAGTTSFASSAGVSIATAGLGGNAAEDMVGTQLQQFFKQAGREATETGTTAGATGGIVYASTGLTTGDWDMARDQAYMAATNATIGSGMTKGVMGQASRIHQQEQAQQTALLGDLAQLGADFNALPPQMQLALLASGSEATNLMAVASANESGLSQAHRTAIATQAVDYTPVAAEEEPDEAGTELTPGHELATDAEAAEGMSLEQEFALNAARQRLEAQWQQGRNDLAVAISGDVERAMQTSEPVLQFTDRSDGGIKNLASDRADRHQALGDVIHTIGRTGPEAEALMAHARKQGMVIAVSRDLPYGAAYVAGDNANNGYDTLLISEDLSSKSPARQAEAIAHELKHAHNEGKHGELYTPTPAAFRPADAADIATQQKAFADSAVAGFVANEREAHITGMRTAQSIDPDIAFSGYKKQIAAVLESAADPQNLTANETAAIDAIIRDHPDYKAEAAELATAASRTFADIYGTTDKPKLDTNTPDANKKLVTQQAMYAENRSDTPFSVIKGGYADQIGISNLASSPLPYARQDRAHHDMVELGYNQIRSLGHLKNLPPETPEALQRIANGGPVIAGDVDTIQNYLHTLKANAPEDQKYLFDGRLENVFSQMAENNQPASPQTQDYVTGLVDGLRYMEGTALAEALKLKGDRIINLPHEAVLIAHGEAVTQEGFTALHNYIHQATAASSLGKKVGPLHKELHDKILYKAEIGKPLPDDAMVNLLGFIGKVDEVAANHHGDAMPERVYLSKPTQGQIAIEGLASRQRADELTKPRYQAEGYKRNRVETNEHNPPFAPVDKAQYKDRIKAAEEEGREVTARDLWNADASAHPEGYLADFHPALLDDLHDINAGQNTRLPDNMVVQTFSDPHGTPQLQGELLNHFRDDIYRRMQAWEKRIEQDPRLQGVNVKEYYQKRPDVGQFEIDRILAENPDLQPQEIHTVFMGDSVDKGIDSAEAVKQILEFQNEFAHLPNAEFHKVTGNHEWWVIRALLFGRDGGNEKFAAMTGNTSKGNMSDEAGMKFFADWLGVRGGDVALTAFRDHPDFKLNLDGYDSTNPNDWSIYNPPKPISYRDALLQELKNNRLNLDIPEANNRIRAANERAHQQALEKVERGIALWHENPAAQDAINPKNKDTAYSNLLLRNKETDLEWQRLKEEKIIDEGTNPAVQALHQEVNAHNQAAKEFYTGLNERFWELPQPVLDFFLEDQKPYIEFWDKDNPDAWGLTVTHGGIDPKLEPGTQKPFSYAWIREETTQSTNTIMGPDSGRPTKVAHGHTIARDARENPIEDSMDLGGFKLGQMTAKIYEGGNSQRIIIRPHPEPQNDQFIVQADGSVKRVPMEPDEIQQNPRDPQRIIFDFYENGLVDEKVWNAKTGTWDLVATELSVDLANDLQLRLREPEDIEPSRWDPRRLDNRSDQNSESRNAPFAGLQQSLNNLGAWFNRGQSENKTGSSEPPPANVADTQTLNDLAVGSDAKKKSDPEVRPKNVPPLDEANSDFQIQHPEMDTTELIKHVREKSDFETFDGLPQETQRFLADTGLSVKRDLSAPAGTRTYTPEEIATILEAAEPVLKQWEAMWHPDVLSELSISTTNPSAKPEGFENYKIEAQKDGKLILPYPENNISKANYLKSVAVSIAETQFRKMGLRDEALRAAIENVQSTFDFSADNPGVKASVVDASRRMHAEEVAKEANGDTVVADIAPNVRIFKNDKKDFANGLEFAQSISEPELRSDIAEFDTHHPGKLDAFLDVAREHGLSSSQAANLLPGYIDPDNDITLEDIKALASEYANTSMVPKPEDVDVSDLEDFRDMPHGDWYRMVKESAAQKLSKNDHSTKDTWGRRVAEMKETYDAAIASLVKKDPVLSRHHAIKDDLDLRYNGPDILSRNPLVRNLLNTIRDNPDLTWKQVYDKFWDENFMVWGAIKDNENNPANGVNARRDMAEYKAVNSMLERLFREDERSYKNDRIMNRPFDKHQNEFTPENKALALSIFEGPSDGIGSAPPNLPQDTMRARTQLINMQLDGAHQGKPWSYVEQNWQSLVHKEDRIQAADFFEQHAIKSEPEKFALTNYAKNHGKPLSDIIEQYSKAPESTDIDLGTRNDLPSLRAETLIEGTLISKVIGKSKDINKELKRMESQTYEFVPFGSDKPEQYRVIFVPDNTAIHAYAINEAGHAIKIPRPIHIMPPEQRKAIRQGQHIEFDPGQQAAYEAEFQKTLPALEKTLNNGTFYFSEREYLMDPPSLMTRLLDYDQVRHEQDPANSITAKLNLLQSRYGAIPHYDVSTNPAQDNNQQWLARNDLSFYLPQRGAPDLEGYTMTDGVIENDATLESSDGRVRAAALREAIENPDNHRHETTMNTLYQYMQDYLDKTIQKLEEANVQPVMADRIDDAYHWQTNPLRYLQMKRSDHPDDTIRPDGYVEESGYVWDWKEWARRNGK
jgi:hypothetical protein